MKAWRNLRYLAIKFGGPIILVAFSLMAIAGALWPWSIAKPVLSKFRGQTPIMVGFRFSERVLSDGRTLDNSRSFILFPPVFRDPKTIIIRKVNDNPPIVSESVYCFFAYAAWLMLGLTGTWWFWLRPRGRNAA